MPRLFTGLSVPDPVGDALAALRGGLHGARWIEPEDYHLTLTFIGDIDGAKAEDVINALAEVESPPVGVTLDGLGVFGGDKPRALIATVAAEPALLRLQAQQERILRDVGVTPDRRKFTPHVTLARLKQTSAGEAAAFLQRASLPRTTYEVAELQLYSARASVGGGPYVIEASYPLAG
jgi:2'-5' RNA ligase